jgi:hypothetical protein
LLLYPKPRVSQKFLGDPSLLRRALDVLNKIPDSLLREAGRSYGGGLYKMEPKELAGASSPELAALFGGLDFESPSADQLVLFEKPAKYGKSGAKVKTASVSKRRGSS